MSCEGKINSQKIIRISIDTSSVAGLVAPRTAAPWGSWGEAAAIRDRPCGGSCVPRSTSFPAWCPAVHCCPLASKTLRHPQRVKATGTLHTQKGRCLFEGFFQAASSSASCRMTPCSHPWAIALIFADLWKNQNSFICKVIFIGFFQCAWSILLKGRGLETDERVSGCVTE